MEDDNLVVGHLIRRLCDLQYEVRGAAHYPANGVPERHCVYVAGRHGTLQVFGHICFRAGLLGDYETEITVLPPEVFIG